MIVSDAFSPAYASNCAKLCSRQRRTRIHQAEICLLTVEHPVILLDSQVEHRAYA